MTRLTAAERVRGYEVTLFRSNHPRMDGTSSYAPTRAVSVTHARIIAEAHAAAEVEAATAELVRERDEARANLAATEDELGLSKAYLCDAVRERGDAQALYREAEERYCREVTAREKAEAEVEQLREEMRRALSQVAGNYKLITNKRLTDANTDEERAFDALVKLTKAINSILASEAKEKEL